MARDEEGKASLSQQEFVWLLCRWLSLHLTEAQIQYAAEVWRIPIETPDLDHKFREELIAIHTWMLGDYLLSVFPDKEKLYAMLDTVHYRVYESLATVPDIDYRTWKAMLARKWDGYYAAMVSTHQEGSFWKP